MHQYYNRYTKDKHFDVGEKVLVLAPDSTSKIYSRWQGLCTSTEIREPYSNVVYMGDSS